MNDINVKQEFTIKFISYILNNLIIAITREIY